MTADAEVRDAESEAIEVRGPPPDGVAIVPTAQPVPSRRIFAAVRSGSGARPAVAAALEALAPLPPG